MANDSKGKANSQLGLLGNIELASANPVNPESLQKANRKRN
jgi:hypothetical protein